MEKERGQMPIFGLVRGEKERKREGSRPRRKTCILVNDSSLHGREDQRQKWGARIGGGEVQKEGGEGGA